MKIKKIPRIDSKIAIPQAVFMFAVVREDEYGKSIEIFKTRQNAQEFFIKVNKIKK